MKRRYRICALATLFLISALPWAQVRVPPAEQATTQALRGDFRNLWPALPPPAGQSVGTTMFNGHVGPYAIPGSSAAPVVPTGGGFRLEQSSFGQPVGSEIPFPEFEKYSRETAGKLLYYDQGAASPGDPYARDKAAFRYKALLYGKDANDAQQRIRANFEGMGSYYGAAERQRSLDAERLLRAALKYAPRNLELRHALLDLFYDRAAAELAFAKEQLVQAYRARLDPAPPGGFVIDNEITLFKDVLEKYRFAMQGYFELLRDPMGVTGSPPFGYTLFHDMVPSRSLYAATYLPTGNGSTLAPVLDENGDGQPDLLFSGYKDLVLLFQMHRDYANAAVELTRRYVMRGSAQDVQAALDLIAQTQQTSYLQGEILLGIFPGYTPAPGDASGLAEAITGWRQALTGLTTTRQFIAGKTNILGFDQDFLMLVQKFQGQSADFFDSYDALDHWIKKDPTAPLNYAVTKLQEANQSYDQYRGYQDQLALQFSDQKNTFESRLFKIVGANPGDPGYDKPELNPGSEINLQVSSIQAAGLRIQQNAQEMTNLQKQVEIEIERRGTEHGINNAISQVFIDYGDKQGRLTEQISQLSATQLFANNIAQSVASTSVGIPCCPSASGGVASYAINAFIQSGLELAKGKLQAQKETLAAHERAEVNSLQDQLLDANSKANIKTWLLRMDTLALQSQELAVLLGQEWARLAGFYSEKADIERQLKEADETLADRYFADPVHRLRMQDATIEAEMSFQEAQRWVYFTARALEYKWNRLFLHTHAGHDWSVASAFKLRNATELNAMVAAMQAFNGLLDGTTVKDDYFDWFSVREDFLGFRRFDGSGNPLKYVDPATGELVNAIEAFRRHLNRLKDAQGNIVLRFGTVREVPGGTFFRGPRFDSSGQVLSRGLYLDKIKWLKIRLPGDHTVPRSQIAGDLSYGGTSFIRNQGVGQVLDPQRPDRVTGEMTPYSTRYWYYDAAPQNPGWRFRESLGAPVQMELSDDPRIPPTVSEIDVFKERSVAATDWSLRISTIDGGETILKINELNDIEIYFYHYAVVRQ